MKSDPGRKVRRSGFAAVVNAYCLTIVVFGQESMTTLPFTKSELYTLGVELELQVLNSRDYNLTGASGDLLALLDKSGHPGDIKPELTEAMIEVATSIQRGYGGLLQELTGIRDALVREAGRLNLGIAGGGAHPFQKWHEQRIY